MVAPAGAPCSSSPRTYRDVPRPHSPIPSPPPLPPPENVPATAAASPLSVTVGTAVIDLKGLEVVRLCHTTPVWEVALRVSWCNGRPEQRVEFPFEPFSDLLRLDEEQRDGVSENKAKIKGREALDKVLSAWQHLHEPTEAELPLAAAGPAEGVAAAKKPPPYVRVQDCAFSLARLAHVEYIPLLREAKLVVSLGTKRKEEMVYKLHSFKDPVKTAKEDYDRLVKAMDAFHGANPDRPAKRLRAGE